MASQAAPNAPKSAASLHDLNGEPDELLGGDVLGRCGGLAGDAL
jgi:hypothetical protein